MDSWKDLHLPVLTASVELFDSQGHGPIEDEQISAHTGLDSDSVRRALRALEHESPPFFAKVEGSMGGDLWITAPTGHARRTVGQWPTAEALASQLVAGLEAAADAEPDLERETWMRKTAAWFGGAGRDVIVSVTSAAVTRGAGLG